MTDVSGCSRAPPCPDDEIHIAVQNAQEGQKLIDRLAVVLLVQQPVELSRADASKPWMRYAGMIETGDPSASQKIDDVIYGQKD